MRVKTKCRGYISGFWNLKIVSQRSVLAFICTRKRGYSYDELLREIPEARGPCTQRLSKIMIKLPRIGWAELSEGDDGVTRLSATTLGKETSRVTTLRQAA